MTSEPISCTGRLPNLAAKTIVVVGMPGSGKSTIGKKLAQKLGMDFYDSDTEIEKSAGQTIPEIFAQHGEPTFRDAERRVIARLLDNKPCIVSTGGGAFMDETTRARIKEKGISLWLDGDLTLLAERTARHSNRPLLNTPDRMATLTVLFEKRQPIFATADVRVETTDAASEETIQRVIAALAAHLSSR